MKNLFEIYMIAAGLALMIDNLYDVIHYKDHMAASIVFYLAGLVVIVGIVLLLTKRPPRDPAPGWTVITPKGIDWLYRNKHIHPNTPTQ